MQIARRRAVEYGVFTLDIVAFYGILPEKIDKEQHRRRKQREAEHIYVGFALLRFVNRIQYFALPTAFDCILLDYSGKPYIKQAFFADFELTTEFMNCIYMFLNLINVEKIF